jgi:type 1 fimbria pilin
MKGWETCQNACIRITLNGMPPVPTLCVEKSFIRFWKQCRKLPINACHRLSCARFFSLLLFFPLATQVQANAGIVNFNATITAPTCTVAATGAATGSGNNISLNFGDSPITPLQPGPIWGSHGRDFILMVTCPGPMTGFTRARAPFTATSGGSGIDPEDPRLLRLTSESTASGVAVGVQPSSAGAPLDLSSNPSLIGHFALSGGNAVASIPTSAIYSRTSGIPRAGSAKATLPFTLTSE